MKTLYLQLSELDEDFFTLSEGDNKPISFENGKESQQQKRKQINRKNFVVKCLEVLFCKLFEILMFSHCSR